jgi:hypothetical protein
MKVKNLLLTLPVLVMIAQSPAQSRELDWLADQVLCTSSKPEKFYAPDGKSELARLKGEGAIIGQGKSVANGDEILYGAKPGSTLLGFPVTSFVFLNGVYPAGSSLAVELKADVDKVKERADRELASYKRAGPFVSKFNSVGNGALGAYVRTVKYNGGSIGQEAGERIGLFRVYLNTSADDAERRTAIYCAVEQQ